MVNCRSISIRCCDSYTFCLVSFIYSFVYDLYVLNDFKLILPPFQLLLYVLVSVDNDGEEDVDQDPAHGDGKEEEHDSGDSVGFLCERELDFDMWRIQAVTNFIKSEGFKQSH